ncbi:MAG TPA: ethanolamine utilization microcompartment protein EutL [Candidatus Copromorpha excrementigallinarum]|uniref:Ethanolamine utilization microcompartment protein EutL n=1 Tax=Candidatus Allocopromorpha excrementigallinarum TaxID=2840742 RepID=A0A9D1I1J6_9FIRM|nr:ethanolamine utilization microcompartment protein EutL [Candidatus Copromorpha excrementigallinarum]
MKGDAVKANVLSVQEIPRADRHLMRALKVPQEYESLGIITTDIDDVSYAALDEATKKARVAVCYAHSMYAGSSNASTRLAGEFIGILAGKDPEEVRSGIDAAVRYIENDAFFYEADNEGGVKYFSHCISRAGSYLSKVAKVKEGSPLAYLIAPPNEAICGIDAALKAAEVEMKVFYGPPTETNFAGGLLTGEQSACEEACRAFESKVIQVAEYPIKFCT